MYALLDETDRDHQACAIALYGAVGFAMNGAPSVRQAILRLADLIDRPTCEDVSVPRGDGFTPYVEFKCSACGCSHVSLTYVYYCPWCGARVVDDD